ncbi:MAG: putative HTH-type transcriptional regulator [Methanosaeta sp. PtaU1.Bin060]|jgi:DNA-binding transcriptional regulator GbsR (MarR family)|nr:MAG: putative HTH-type transcriptional regulator [Methanosaeta sp. PtaU1.Bin060]
MNKAERDALKRHIVDACVKGANSRGYGDAVGVLRGTLFLAIRPMSMDQLVEETGYSKSTVSFNMSILENLGLARRVITPGDKRYHYLAVTDHNSMKKAMLVNVKNENQLIMTALDMTEKDLVGKSVSQAILDKISDVRSFYRKTDRLLELVSRYTTDEMIELLEREGR